MEHLSPEELSAYLTGSMSAEERANVERHLVTCPECRSELIEGQRAAATAPSTRGTNRNWYAIAALAAAAVIVIAIWPRGELTRAPAPVERNTPPAVSPAAISIVSPAPEAQLDIPSRTFTWRSDEGSSYRISVTDEAGQSIWSQATQDTTISLPDSVKLAPGGRYFWYVDALRADGRSVTSGINSFRTSR